MDNAQIIERLQSLEALISKKVPGSCKYYEFDEPEELAKSIYRNINDDMADEAKKVFEYATKLFIEMYESV